MTKFQLNRADAPWEYPSLGFVATTSTAILDGSLSTPPITVPPDAYWSVYVGGSAETGITRFANPVGPDPATETPDGYILAYSDDANRFVETSPADFVAVPEVAAALSASYVPKAGDVDVAGTKTFVAFPEVHKTGDRDVTGALDFTPGNANYAGWQAHLKGPGRLFHLMFGDNLVNGSLIAMGVDYGNANYPSGLLIANKAQSRGIYIHQQSTLFDSFSNGLYMFNESPTAVPARFEQAVTNHQPYQFIASQAGASDRLVEFQATAGQAGYVSSQSGQLTWNRSMFLASASSSVVALTVNGNTTLDGGSLGSGATIPVIVQGRATQSVDVFRIRAVGGSTNQARFNKAGYLIRALTSAPADADLNASEHVTWLDATPGATKIMFKAKDSGGTVRTGSVALS